MSTLSLPMPPGTARLLRQPRDLAEQRRQWIYLWLGYIFTPATLILGVVVGLRTRWDLEAVSWLVVGAALALATLPAALLGRVRHIVPIICAVVFVGCTFSQYRHPGAFGSLGGLASLITLVSLTESPRRILYAGVLSTLGAASPALLHSPNAPSDGGLDMSSRVGTLFVITGIAYVGSLMSNRAIQDLRTQIRDNQAKARVLHQRMGSLEGTVEERTETLAARTAELEATNHDLRAAIEVETALAEQLRMQSLHDELTSLVNRRGFMSTLTQAEPQGGWIVMADLDHFKSINDTWGHPAGDDALRHFSRTLRDLTPTGGLAARVGGEEFAVVLPGHFTHDDLRLFLQELLTAVRALTIPSMQGHQLTVSLGAAGFAPRRDPAAGPPPQLPDSRLHDPATPGTLMMRRNALEALRRADHALYRAKRDGRNRAVINPTIVGQD